MTRLGTPTFADTELLKDPATQGQGLISSPDCEGSPAVDARSKIKRVPATVLRGMDRHLPRRADFAAAVKQAHRAAIALVLPPRCLWCHVESDAMPHEIMLCAECQRLLAGAEVPRCVRCGGRLATPSGACAHCHGVRLRFDSVVALGSHAAALRECVLRLKHRGQESLAIAIANLLFERRRDLLAQAQAEAVLPVPMHWGRRLVRRANNPELLAATLAARMNLPLEDAALRRVRNTSRQGPMLRTERLRNVRGAFRLRPDAKLRGKRLLLVDDVLTTGATCDEIAKVLRRAGAAAVTVAVLARADA
jgi:ComF family protein